MQKRKIPMRMCAGCGAHKDKREMIRVVRQKDGTIRLDTTGKLPGRGAYLCYDTACLQKCRKNGRLARSFACQIPPEVFDALEQQLSDAAKEAAADAK